MNYNDASDKKMAIIEKTWEYLLTTGLSHASIGDLCRQKKIAQSSLYYWFKNKDDIWITAGKYGLSKIVDALFAFTLDNTDNLSEYFATLLDEVDKYKQGLRLAIQITTSPLYGEYMREKSKEFNILYQSYGEQLVAILGCTPRQAKVFIYSIVIYVIDYAIWDDREQTQMLLDNLFNLVLKAIDVQK